MDSQRFCQSLAITGPVLETMTTSRKWLILRITYGTAQTHSYSETKRNISSLSSSIREQEKGPLEDDKYVRKEYNRKETSCRVYRQNIGCPVKSEFQVNTFYIGYTYTKKNCWLSEIQI